MRKFLRVSISTTLGAWLLLSAGALLAQATAEPNPCGIAWTPIPGPGKKCAVNGDYHLVYEFGEKPKMGISILRIRVFDKKNNQVVPFKMTGRSDMPSMRGAHDSGAVDLKLDRKNNYVLPVNVVMPGDWETQVTVFSNGKPVFYGSIRFHV